MHLVGMELWKLLNRKTKTRAVIAGHGGDGSFIGFPLDSATVIESWFYDYYDSAKTNNQ